MSQGIRVGSSHGRHEYEPGEYGQDEGGRWWAMAPNGMLCNLSRHGVEEHEDGTITVSPSILVSDNKSMWHGFLERGIWKGVLTGGLQADPQA